MSTTAWTSRTNPGTWDNLILDGNLFPGIWRVEVNLPVEIDIQKGKGTQKARLKDEGDQPAKLTIKGKLGAKGKEQEELDVLAKLLPLIKTKSTKAGRAPRTIRHPNPNFWGITKIVIAGIRSPMPDPVSGWEIEIDAIEWVPQPKKVKKATIDREAENKKAWAVFEKQRPQPGLMSGGSQMSEAGPNASYAPSAGAPPAKPTHTSAPADNMSFNDPEALTSH